MILNASSKTLDQDAGTLPNMESTLLNYFRPMTFEKLTKTVSGFQARETAEVITGLGVIQPLTGKQLLLKPEGQRAWSWFQLHIDTSLLVDVDEIIIHLGTQYRVMAQKDYSLYGYMEYELVTDWTGNDPEVAP